MCCSTRHRLRHRRRRDLLIDIDGTREQVDRDTEIVEQVLRRSAVEVRRADDDDACTKLWYGRLHAPDVAVRSGKGFFVNDVTVPYSRKILPDAHPTPPDAGYRLGVVGAVARLEISP